MNKKELIDKQELIDELAKYVKSYENAMDEHGQGRYGAYEVSLKLVKRLNESKITDEQAWNKVAEAYPESAQSLRNTLDNAVFGKTGEPQKPVIPQLVAGWLEKSTDPFTKAEKIAYLINSKDGDSYYFCDWFVRDGILTQEQGEELLAWATRQSYETLLSLYNGYEVEKEPKYIVKIGKLYLKEPLGDTSNFTILTTWDKKCAYPFSSFHMADIHAAKFEGAVEEEAEG
ncbi:DUF1642 domain-containing protein [Enterococcus faecium]|uniref:DUF1642 domain-containing protein n=1 Tax=Enterococcus faecium TaxID=1352 RepID=UPI00111DF878|nr:DUF1642 domain-containing protein [Enterococcus faecium]TNX46093.1 DUF1642 domain-containing protein [Enterococcus faecium]